ncbi:hypothetical protein RR46_07561 [Papilio xuthus]|uniref:Uncharacterized protein n=1 Tax=Papilio xuthus TaxID=66420 RepID=A0A194Q599_PAPXU|nr:hypothetical protein RR46_07561 [Papilio xuthus]
MSRVCNLSRVIVVKRHTEDRREVAIRLISVRAGALILVILPFPDFPIRKASEEESKNAARIFTEQSSSLLERLEVFERQLHERIASHIPRDLDSLEHLVLQHKDWETGLHGLATDVEEVQNTFRSIALKTPAMKKNLDKVMGKWNDMQSKSQLFVERLKFVEIIVNSMEENNQTISEFEIKLAQFHDLPNDEEMLKDVSKHFY